MFYMYYSIWGTGTLHSPVKIEIVAEKNILIETSVPFFANLHRLYVLYYCMYVSRETPFSLEKSLELALCFCTPR